VHGDALRAEEHFRGAQNPGVVALVEDIAQNDVNELVDKERRRAARPFTDQRQISRFDRRVAQQMVAERDHHGPVFSGVGVGNGRDFVGIDRTARIGHERCVQCFLDDARFGRRREFRSREIDFQELVGDDKPAALADIEEVMTAGEPEVLHLLFSLARPTRSTSSTGSSSPSTSRKAKARSGFLPSRGRSVRKASRIAPSSTVR
jgi:hypothetical protein